MRLRRTSGFPGKRRRTAPERRQKGFVLIELLVAIAIFGVVSVAFLSALVAGYHGVIVAHDQTMAESLTRTTLEDASKASFPLADNVTQILRYDVVVRARYVNTDNYGIESTPTGIQMVTVTIRHHVSQKTIKETSVIKVQAS